MKYIATLVIFCVMYLFVWSDETGIPFLDKSKQDTDIKEYSLIYPINFAFDHFGVGTINDVGDDDGPIPVFTIKWKF